MTGPSHLRVGFKSSHRLLTPYSAQKSDLMAYQSSLFFLKIAIVWVKEYFLRQPEKRCQVGGISPSDLHSLDIYVYIYIYILPNISHLRCRRSRKSGNMKDFVSSNSATSPGFILSGIVWGCCCICTCIVSYLICCTLCVL